MDKPVVYVVVLNWNGWQDTIACLETLFASQHVTLRVVVCDNASSDDSMQHIIAWASGRQPAEIPTSPRLARLMRNVAPPISYDRFSRSDAESQQCTRREQLILIDNGANLGFAAGNNVGLRFALNQPDMDYVWLLNNDTVVEPDCLANMIARVQHDATGSVCGSMIHFFDQPEIIQAIGGNRFSRLTGRAARSEGRFSHESEISDTKEIETTLDYLSGCSLLLPRCFLKDVGLMSEDFFLYYEEIDWFTRAGSQYRICVAANANIYHKEGSSIGSQSWGNSASALSEFHMFRSQLIFMRKHRRKYLPFCYAYLWALVAKRALQGQHRNALAIGSMLLGSRTFSS